MCTLFSIHRQLLASINFPKPLFNTAEIIIITTTTTMWNQEKQNQCCWSNVISNESLWVLSAIIICSRKAVAIALTLASNVSAFVQSLHMPTYRKDKDYLQRCSASSTLVRGVKSNRRLDYNASPLCYYIISFQLRGGKGKGINSYLNCLKDTTTSSSSCTRKTVFPLFPWSPSSPPFFVCLLPLPLLLPCVPAGVWICCD